MNTKPKKYKIIPICTRSAGLYTFIQIVVDIHTHCCMVRKNET